MKAVTINTVPSEDTVISEYTTISEDTTGVAAESGIQGCTWDEPGPTKATREVPFLGTIVGGAFGQIKGHEPEYSASEVRGILQQLFPTRRLVLSQFTFFNQVGVAKPTGATSRRGRRCYRLQDLLSIATVLALKEEGIPLKNIERVPTLVQSEAERIFAQGDSCKLSGFGPDIRLMFPGDPWENTALDLFFSRPEETLLFWSYDVGALARQLNEVAASETRGTVEAPASGTMDRVSRAA